MAKKRVPLIAQVIVYTKDGTIKIDKALCFITKNMRDTLVLNVPRKGLHYHLYPKGNHMTDESKEDKKERYKSITKEDFDKLTS